MVMGADYGYLFDPQDRNPGYSGSQADGKRKEMGLGPYPGCNAGLKRVNWHQMLAGHVLRA